MHPWSHETFSLVCFIWFLHVILLDFCIILCHDHNISNVFPNVLSSLILLSFRFLFIVFILSSAHHQAHMSLGIVLDSFQVSCMQWCPSSSSHQVCENELFFSHFFTICELRQSFCYLNWLSNFDRLVMFFQMNIK